MDDKKEEGCCSEKECECGSGGGCGTGGRCCAGKAFGLLALLLVVGVIGFLLGRGHCGKMMGACPFSSAPMSAPVVPAK